MNDRQHDRQHVNMNMNDRQHERNLFCKTVSKPIMFYDFKQNRKEKYFFDRTFTVENDQCNVFTPVANVKSKVK